MKEVIYAILIVCAVILALVYAAITLDRASCQVKGQSFDSVEYSVIGGCMVKHHDKWLPLDNIRGFDDK